MPHIAIKHSIHHPCKVSIHSLKGLSMRNFTALLFCMLISTLSEAAPEVNATLIKGQNFSVRDVQQHCIAKRESGEALSIYCNKAKLKPVERSCEGLITRGLDTVKFSCGGALWVLNSVCKIEMRGSDKGEINCVF